MLGEAHLCVCFHPQHKCPSHLFLNPTIQSLRKALVPQEFVVNKELQKQKEEANNCAYKNKTLSQIPSM